ncbi:FG-GAP repeat protein, partial [bacterium]|nr:FG-GAP repeat protein [bacterium]
VAPDGTGGEQFGYSVSISGNYALIGAFRDQENGGQAGAAYIWWNNGSSWQYVHKLTPNVPEAGMEFGNAVSIDGDHAVVCGHRAKYLDDMIGAAYVFERCGTTWIEKTKIFENDLTPSGFFGCAADISGNTLIVGARSDATSGTNTGAAYTFTNNGTQWAFDQKLTASDAAASANFGVSVALWSNWALVGSDAADGTVPDTGAAYIFQYSSGSWIQKSKLSPELASPDQSFGWAVDIEDGYAVIGAPWYSTENIQLVGKVSVFILDGTEWLPRMSLVASDMNVNAQLGFSVSVQSDETIVGAYGAYHDESYPGAAYWFQDFSVPNPTPTPTPSVITYDIDMYDKLLANGDLFSLTRSYFNPLTPLDVDEYIILDVYGCYWFWPGWSEVAESQRWNLPGSAGADETILEFPWPEVAGEATDLIFWGAFLVAETVDLVVYDFVEWGYSNK